MLWPLNSDRGVWGAAPPNARRKSVGETGLWHPSKLIALRDLPLDDWEPYLLAGSNLPGPRGNLEQVFSLDSFPD